MKKIIVIIICVILLNFLTLPYTHAKAFDLLKTIQKKDSHFIFLILVLLGTIILLPVLDANNSLIYLKDENSHKILH